MNRKLAAVRRVALGRRRHVVAADPNEAFASRVIGFLDEDRVDDLIAVCSLVLRRLRLERAIRDAAAKRRGRRA